MGYLPQWWDGTEESLRRHCSALAKSRSKGLPMKIKSIGQRTRTGATGAGCLVDGRPCSGLWADYSARTEDHELVTITITHYWNSDGELERVDAEGPDGQDVEGDPVELLKDTLTELYEDEEA